ncbi:MAG TPA: phage holin family protein [Firmicutes bacterium]|nr:phage holin family protein [Bacillota bacterium]
MSGILTRWLINTVALLIVAFLIDGIKVSGFGAALIAAAVLGVVNAFIRPVIMLFTLPFNVLTLGLLTFVINGFMLQLTSAVVSGFEVKGLWAAIIGSLILSLVSSLLSWVIAV